MSFDRRLSPRLRWEPPIGVEPNTIRFVDVHLIIPSGRGQSISLRSRRVERRFLPFTLVVGIEPTGADQAEYHTASKVDRYQPRESNSNILAYEA